MIALNVKPGMTIFSQDNVKLGTVQEVWAETAAHGCLPVSRYHLQDYGPVKGTGPILSTEQGYVQIRQNKAGGFRRRDLWVPLHAITRVDTDKSGTLKADAHTLESHFVRQPEGLQQAA